MPVGFDLSLHSRTPTLNDEHEIFDSDSTGQFVRHLITELEDIFILFVEFGYRAVHWNAVVEVTIRSQNEPAALGQ